MTEQCAMPDCECQRIDFGASPIQGTGPVWEPWEPKVGDRVKVNFSAECEVINMLGSPAAESTIPRGHAADINAQGKSGTIAELELGDEAVSSQHHYLVRLDDPFEFSNRYFTSTTAAAIELTLIEAESEVAK